MVRNTFSSISTWKRQLAVCSRSYSGYESLCFYQVISTSDVEINFYRGNDFEDGYFVHNIFGQYDYFPIDEFNDFFVIADNCEENSICKRLNNCFLWLRKNKHINVSICPNISDDGYSCTYSIEISYPFTASKGTERELLSYENAAKTAIKMVKRKCLNHYGKKGITEWLKFIVI